MGPPAAAPCELGESARRTRETVMARWGFGVLAVVAATLLTVSGGPTPAARAATGPPNIVVILTDDQRYDALGSMPNVKQLLIAHGVRFTHAFDNNPLCCPARA